MNTDPADGERTLTKDNEELDDVDSQVVEDLDVAEDAEGVRGGISSQCQSG